MVDVPSAVELHRRAMAKVRAGQFSHARDQLERRG